MSKYTPTSVQPHEFAGGKCKHYQFPNGYEASVVSHRFSYGGDRGLWELAVIHSNKLVYDTPVTSDVEGHLTEDDVERLLDQIAALPPRE